MNVFLFAANAVAPIVILMLVGYFLKVKNIFDEAFFKQANRFVFRVGLPVMLFLSVYDVESLTDIKWNAVIFAVAVITLLFVIGFFCTFFIKDRKQKGVVWQAFFRGNATIIGIPLAISLGGQEALPVASIVSAFCITAYNVFSIIALSLYTGEDKKSSVGGFLKSLAKNQLLMSILLGLVVVFVRNLLPVNELGNPIFTVKDNLSFVYEAMGMISKMTTPLSLIVLGGMFSFSAVKELKNQIIIGTSARIVLAPAIGLGLAIALKNTLGFGAPEFAAFVSMFGPPAAVSGLSMAAEMNNDESLAGQIVVWTTVFSIFTIYFTTVILKYFQVI